MLVLTGRLDRVPAPALVPLCLLLAVATAQCFTPWWWAAAVLAGAILTDALLLGLLPRLGVSFGRIGGPLSLFTAGRLLLALPLSLLPPAAALYALVALQALLTGCSLWGHLVAPFRIEVVRVPAPILEAAPARPVRLLLVTDLHVERRTRREERALALARELAPDLVLFGGDLLNLSYVGDPRAAADARWFMEGLAAVAPLRVVLGNPTVEVREVVEPFWASLGVRPLDGALERLTLQGAPLLLAGLPTSSDGAEDRARLRELCERAPELAERPSVLLYHMPDLAAHAAGFDLLLCGHTHGGQIRLPLIGPVFTASRAPRRLAAGTHRVGGTLLHTSRGLGLEGSGAPRMRFLCRPELTLVTLTARSPSRPRDP